MTDTYADRRRQQDRERYAALSPLEKAAKIRKADEARTRRLAAMTPEEREEFRFWETRRVREFRERRREVENEAAIRALLDS